ncbi:polysaccharide deacetylase family protein [Patescibacteria group bacterium]|nr:polysaccharide deacetylase family protein [Patescibacteria group bacterium]
MKQDKDKQKSNILKKERVIILTFDLEDWFHSKNFSIPYETWDNQPSLLIDNTKMILDILDLYNIKATFFTLGWIAEKYPELIKDIYKKGHEVASHGYKHDYIYEMQPNDFRNDLKITKNIIENLIGVKVIGYRAPVFSVTATSINILTEEGYLYDVSYFPLKIHDRYSKNIEFSSFKSVVRKNGYYLIDKSFYEIEIPILAGIPIGGGGYFRLSPLFLWNISVETYLKTVRTYYIMYLHPWDFDHKNYVRISNLGFKNQFRQYVGLSYSKKKFLGFLNKFSKNYIFLRIRDLIERWKI